MAEQAKDLRQACDSVAQRLVDEYRDIPNDFARKQFFLNLLELIPDEKIIVMHFGFALAPRKDNTNE